MESKDAVIVITKEDKETLVRRMEVLEAYMEQIPGGIIPPVTLMSWCKLNTLIEEIDSNYGREFKISRHGIDKCFCMSMLGFQANPTQ